MISTVRSNRPIYSQEDNQYQNNTTNQNQQNSQFIDNNQRSFCETCWCCECCGLLILMIFILIFSFVILILEIVGIFYGKEITAPPLNERIVRIVFCCVVIICIIIIKIYEKKGDKFFTNFSIILAIFALVLAFIGFYLNFVGYFSHLYDYNLFNNYIDCNFNSKCEEYNKPYVNETGYIDRNISSLNKACLEKCEYDTKKLIDRKWRNKNKINDMIEKDTYSGNWEIKSSNQSIVMAVYLIPAYFWQFNGYFFIIILIRMFTSNDNPPKNHEPANVPIYATNQ